MEVKCDICGTVNDGDTTFCKGCFQKLNAERKENTEINDIPKVISTIEAEKPNEIPWNNDNYEVDNEVKEDVSEVTEENTNESSSLEDAFSVMPEMESISNDIDKITENLNNNSVEENTTNDLSSEMEPIASPTLAELENANSDEEVKEEPVQEENKETEENATNDLSSEMEPIASPTLAELENAGSDEEVKEESNQGENKDIEENISNDINSEIESISAPTLEELENTNSDEEFKEEPNQEENKDIEENVSNDFNFEMESISAPTLAELENTNSNEDISNQVEEDKFEEVEVANTENNINSLTLDDIESLNRDNEPTAKGVEDGIDNLVEQFHEGIKPKKKKDAKSIKSIVLKYVISFLIRYAILFVAVFGILLIVSKFLPNFINKDTAILIEFILNRLAALLTLVFATKLTFKKEVPDIELLDSVSFKILFFVALPFIVIQMFILGFIKNTTVLMFIIGVILSVIILAIFFNHIRGTIRRRNEDKSEDKVFFKYGIISIIIVVVLLFTGMFLRSKNLVMPKINLFYKVLENTNSDIDIVTKFVKQVQDTMYANVLEGAEKGEEYKVPVTITDTKLAAYDKYEPDSIALNLSENGTVTNGKIVYRGVSYDYDGKNIKAE